MIKALFGCFSGKQQQLQRSKLDLRKNFFPNKIEAKQTEDEDKFSWQEPSIDVMDNILQRVRIGDRLRLSLVSKSWNSIVTRRDLRGAPHELPWLLLPHPRRWKYLSFLSLSEGKLVKLKRPKTVRGGWIYGSTKGSLIIVKGQGLKSTMFLVNPISGALDQLPPFKTIPSFRKYVKTREWKRFGAKLFCPRIAVSISDSDNFCSNCWTMVAAIIEHQDGNTYLGVCRPGDKKWSVFKVLDGNQDDKLVDIMYSSGTLYALVRNSQKDSEVAAIRSLKFEDNGAELKLKLVYDKHENINESIIDEIMHDRYAVVYNAGFSSTLSESSNNEVLIIHQWVDAFWRRGNDNIDDDGDDVIHQDYDNNEGNIGNGGGGEENDENIDLEHEDAADYENDDGIDEDHDENNPNNDNQNEEEVPQYPYMPTRSFRIYKIDPDNDNFVPVQSLGDHVLFIGEDISFSLPAADFKENEKNCIYFATNIVYELELAPKRYLSREIGIFDLSGDRIVRPFPSLVMSLRYQPTWFTPRF